MYNLILSILHISITVAIGFLLYYVVPFVKKKATELQDTEIEYQIDKLVKAAEMIFNGAQGYKKKDKVMSEMKIWLKGQGIDFDDETLSNMVEAAVYDLKYSE